jgi:hypothetical protein
MLHIKNLMQMTAADALILTDTLNYSFFFHFYLFGSSDQTNNGSETSDPDAVNCKIRN